MQEWKSGLILTFSQRYSASLGVEILLGMPEIVPS